MTHLTDEQLDACLDRVDEWRKTWDTFSGPEFDNLRRACNDIIELVVTCKNERAAHQATQAELEVAQEIVELVRKEGMYWPDVQAMADARLADYDAARAEGAE